MRRAGALLVLVVVLAGCSSSDPEPAAKPRPSTTSTVASTLPPYGVEEAPPEFGEYYVRVTMEAADTATYRAVFDEVRQDYATGDEWWIEFECPDGTTLATGRYALTAKGEAASGLGPDRESFEVELVEECPQS